MYDTFGITSIWLWHNQVLIGVERDGGMMGCERKGKSKGEWGGGV